MDSLSFAQKVKVAPFFSCIVLQKVWVMADLCQTLTKIAEDSSVLVLTHMAMLLPVLTVVSIQLTLHLAMRFSMREAILGSVANLTTLWRPTHNESLRNQAFLFYKYETLISSILYTEFSAISLTLNYTVVQINGIPWASWTSLGVALTCLIMSQLYIGYGKEVLYPDDILINQDSWRDILATLSLLACWILAKTAETKSNLTSILMSFETLLER